MVAAGVKDPAHLEMDGVEEVEPRACKEGRDCIWPKARVRRLQRRVRHAAGGCGRQAIASARDRIRWHHEAHGNGRT